MNTDSTDAAWAAARAAEPDTMSRDEIAVLLADVRRARSCLDAIEMRASRRMRELASVGRSEPAESMIANAGGHSGRDARSITERDELCEQMPDIEDALAEGNITAGYVDAISAAARDLPEALRAEYAAMADELLAQAGRLSLDAFRRNCRKLARKLLADSRSGEQIDELAARREASKISRWVDSQTGMHHTHIELDPVRDAKLHSLAKAELARLRATDGSKNLSWQQLQVDAFVNAAIDAQTPITTDPADGSSGRGGEPVGRSSPDRASGSDDDGCGRDGRCHATPIDRVPEITALVSYEWLSGLADDGVCETEAGVPIPIATMRRLCCDAEIIPAVLGGDGEVLDHGRSRRTASRSQRRALRAMHRGCAHQGCNVGFDACRIHHIRWWWRDAGPTDIDNLLPLCERHHHLVHEGGWALTMEAGRVATWRRPDGTVHHRGPTIDRSGHDRMPTDEMAAA